MSLEVGGGIPFLWACKHTEPGLSAKRMSKLNSPSSHIPEASPRLFLCSRPLSALDPTWGYTRIVGALSNVGHDIARTTVAKKGG